MNPYNNGLHASAETVNHAPPTPPQPMTLIPGSIVKAISRIQVSVEAISKSQRNNHGGYQFASTDDIYAGVTRKMGEVGLVIIPLETKHEIVKVEKDGKTVQWLHACFSFVLATEDATWEHPSCRRSLYIQVTGPQTHQAAQSYAEKAFLRSLFKLPTGDMDLDSLPQADTEEDQVALASKKPKSAYRARKDGANKVFETVDKEFRAAKTQDDLDEIRDKHAQEIADMPPEWIKHVADKYEYHSERIAVDGEAA